MLKRRAVNTSFSILILVPVMLLCFQMIGNVEFSFSLNAAADNYWEPYCDSDFGNWTFTNITMDQGGNLTLEQLVSGNYTGSGNGTSIPINTGADGIWKTLNWEATTPLNTSVSFQIKTGTTLADCNLNPFSGPNGSDSYYTTSGNPIAENQNRGGWIQYAVFFNSTNNSITPVLHNVSAAFNFFPQLQGGVSPALGYVDTSFNFTSSYSDRNNAPPSKIEVIIDGVNHPMIERNGNDDDYTDGKEFLYNTTLAVGSHSYWYISSDGELNCSTDLMYVTVAEESDEDDDEDPTLEDLKTVDIFPKNDIVMIGRTIHFNAEGINKTGGHMAINTTWAVNGGGTIDEYGLFTAIAPGNWFVYANVSGVPGRTTFTVSDGKLHTIIIKPESPNIPLGGHQSFTFEGFDKLGLLVNIDPQWSVNGGGTIASDGRFSGSKLGTWTVYANASGISGSTTVKVGGLYRIEVTSNETSENETIINVTESINFTAKGYDSEGVEINFTPMWSVNGGGTIINGTFTATAPGRRVITASFGDVAGSVNVTVIIPDIPEDTDDTTKDDTVVDDESDRSMDKFRKWAKDNFPTVMLLLVILLLVFSVVIYLVFRKKKSEDEDEYGDEDWAEEVSPDGVTWGKPLVREEKVEKEDTNEWEELDTISEWDTWTVTDYDLESAKPVKRRYRRERRGRYRPEMDKKIEWDTGPLGKGEKKTWSRYKPRVKKRRSGRKKKGKGKLRKEDYRDEDDQLEFDDLEDEEFEYRSEEHRDEDDLPEFDEEFVEDEEDIEEDVEEDVEEGTKEDVEEYDEVGDEDVGFWEEETLDEYEEDDFWYED